MPTSNHSSLPSLNHSRTVYLLFPIMMIQCLIALALSAAVSSSALAHRADLARRSTNAVGSPVTTPPSDASKFGKLPAFPSLDNSASACLIISATGDKRCFPSGFFSIRPDKNYFNFDYAQVDAIAIPSGSRFSFDDDSGPGVTTSVDRQHNSSIFNKYDGASTQSIFFTLAQEPVVACLVLPGTQRCFQRKTHLP